MSTVVYRPPPRRQPPALPKGEILFESPPDLPEQGQGGAMGRLVGFLPIMAGGGAMAFMFTSGGVGGPQRVVMSVLIAVSMVGMTISQAVNRKGERKAQVETARRDYSRYLTKLRGRVRTAVTRQRAALEWRYPGPDALPGVAMSGRLWERRPGDSDFAHARVASGRQRLVIKLIPPETKPVEDLDPVSAGALRRFVSAHNTVPDLPVALGMGSFARVSYAGDTDLIRRSLRAQLCHLAAFHSPADLLVAACVSPDRRAGWDWLKWLPHALHPVRQDAVGRLRLVAGSMAELEEQLDDVLDGRARFAPAQRAAATADASATHLVIVLDGGQLGRSRVLATPPVGVTILDVGGALDRGDASGHLRLLLIAAADGARLATVEPGRQGDTIRELGHADLLSIGSAEAFARSIAGFRATGGSPVPHAGQPDSPAVQSTSRDLDLTAMLGIHDAGRLDLPRTWALRPQRDRLRVPFGVGADGAPVELDIKESAQGGMGPHGLVIGATGSGKSELLRTLVLAMVASHSPDDLNLVLVDFKGGATFLGFEELPHVSAVITNLEEELILVDRMQDAIAGEINRRQELLRHAGNYASLRDYEAAREAGAPLDPLPTLWIVVDEFSELLSAKPEFLDLFVMIGRLGRSLGVHLLLASQRLEEGRLRGLDTHLSYRIGLRTFSTGESRSVLGVPDAYELPAAPGHGYLKVATEPLQRFRVAFAGAPYEAPLVRQPDTVEQLRTPATVFVAKVAAFSTLYVEPRTPEPVVEPVSLRRTRTDPAAVPSAAPSEAAAEPADDRATGTVFDVMVQQLQHRGRPAHQVWLPPLDVPATLDALLPDLTPIPGLGLQPADWPQRGALGAPIGLVDKPYLQRRDPLWIDLAGAGGNLAVVGAPQSGKSTLLRSLISAFALTHTPDQVQFYCLDLGGGGLASIDGLPHVGGVAARLSADAVRRTVGEMTALLDQRERVFGAHGVDSMRTYRRLRADGEIPADRFAPDVFLAVDGWSTLRAEYEPLEAQVAAVAARGLGYGIHVLATAPRWLDFRVNIKDSLQTRLELRVGDPYDSEVDRKAAANVPARQPGRGLTPAGMHFLTALPRIDGAGDTPAVDDLADGSRAMSAAVAAAWAGDRAPRVRLLPDELPESAVGATSSPHAIPIGIDEGELEPVSLDFAAEPHFVVMGANECGKSNLLDLIVRRVSSRLTPEEARIVVLDYRRSLLDSVPGSHLLGYAASSSPAEKLMADVSAALRKRLPGPDIRPGVLRSRSWWTGPDLFVVVDDYELVATSTGNPVAAIADLIPQAADVGLHVVLARGFGGAGRAMYDPVIQRIRDMGNPGLIMSGSRDEGALWSGVRGEPMPAGRGQFISRRHGARLVQTAVGQRAPVG